MIKNEEKLTKIFTNFLKGESAATEDRILSIRRFLDIVEETIETYLVDNKDNLSEAERKEVARMLDDMAEIYREEISQLLVKRGRLSEFMSMLSASAISGGSVSYANSPNLFIN